MIELLLRNNSRRKQRRIARRLNASKAFTFEYPSVENFCEKRNQLFSYINFLDQLFILSPQLFNICADFTSCAKIIEALNERYEGSGNVLKKLYLFSKDDILENHYLSASLLLVLKFASIESYSRLIQKIHYYVSHSQFAYKKAFVLILKNGIKHYKISSANINLRTQWDSFIPLNIYACNDEQYAIEFPGSKIMKRQVKEEDRRKLQEALCGILVMFDTFFDIYKKNAFQSTIEEPAQSYFDKFGEDKDRMISSFRSLQVYAYLINKKNWFGQETQTSVMRNEELLHEDCIDLLAGLPHQSCELFKEETTSWLDNEYMKDLEKNGILKTNNQEKYKIFNESAAIMSNPTFLLCATRFSVFFRKDVLIKRTFEVLNSYDRFRKNCNDLYPMFKEEHGFQENTIIEFLYDGKFGDLNIDKATHFFWFCGIIREKDAQITSNIVPKYCSRSKRVQDCRQNVEMFTIFKDEIIDHDDSAAFIMKDEISGLNKRRKQISKCAKAG